jgi:acyl-CoA synthetase (AMP-forming)/AMP-acid ligase II
VTERRTDLIVSGGMNVYPSEVAHCIGRLPGVREVAVVGIAHERWGQTPVAVVVPDRDAGLTEADVIAHCKRHIARFKAPSRVEFVDGLPISASNKVLRRVLRDTLGGLATR